MWAAFPDEVISLRMAGLETNTLRRYVCLWQHHLPKPIDGGTDTVIKASEVPLIKVS